MNAFFIFWAVFCPAVILSKVQQNIVLIIVDDLGWNDVGYHGSNQIKTPNIDALAYTGVILSRHYVLPSCTPSRAALLTGKFPIRTGMQGYPLKGGENRNLPLSVKLLPEWMKSLGYTTHMVGKWHLGYETYNHVPNHRGFDSFFGYYNGFINYYRYDYNQSLSSSVGTGDDVFRGYDLHHNDDVYKPETPIYATTLFADRARQVIEEHDKSKPLFLYLSHVAPHTGNDEPMAMQVPEDADVNKTYDHIKDYGRRVFAGCLEELDRSVGTVMEALRKNNMLENTLVVIMSDNGGHTVSVDMSPNWSSNWPLSGTKFTLYEGGVRGAALMWGNQIGHGYINEGFMHITDWLPTFYGAAGGNVKDLGDLDGIYQWEALKNLRTVPRDNLLLNIDERAGIEGVIINNRYKVVKGGFDGYANYDLRWGKEENVAPNPKYNFSAVSRSSAAIAVKEVISYAPSLFLPSNIEAVRTKNKVKCVVAEHGVKHKDGFVPASSQLRCPNYCVFDLINDPCEVHDLQDGELIETGMKYLTEYKSSMINQKLSFVDPESNPSLFDGVWTPWRFKSCHKSFAGEFTATYLGVAVFITMTWYSLKAARRSSIG